MNERRRDKRVVVELPATVKVGKKPLAGSTINVSFHGLSVKMDEPPALRQLVQVELELPGGKAFGAHFMVVHSGNNVVGLEFFGRSSHDDWDQFVQTLLRQQSGASASLVPPPLPPPRSPLTAAAGERQVPGPPPRPLPGGPPPPPPPRPGSLGPRPPTAPGPTTGSRPAPPPLRSAAPPPLPPAPAPLPGTSAPSIQPPAVTPAPQGPPHHPTPPPYNGPERRRAPRIHMQLELRLRTPRSIHTARTLSVSMIGATVVVSDLQAQPGETLIINLIQPGTNFSFRRDGVLKTVTAVEGAWVHAGIEFTMLDSARELLFAEFMNTAYAALKS